MQGKIHRLIRGKGFGFILVEEQQYFFHHTEVREIEFRRLGVGDTVEFQVADVGVEGKNPRAVEVRLLAKAEPPPLPAAAPAPPPKPSRRPAPRAPRPRRPATATDDNFTTGLFQDAARADDLEFASDVASSGPSDGAEMVDEPTGGGSDYRPASRPAGRRERPQSRSGRTGGRGSPGRPRVGSRPDRQREPRVQRPKATGVPGERGEGVVRSLNAERGFGFIETATGDLFFHRSHVRDNFGVLNVGSRVAFVFGEGDRGAQAQDVSVVV